MVVLVLAAALAALLPPPARAAGPHDYFESLRARPEAVAVPACVRTGDPKGCSLRSQVQLDRLVADATAYNFTYDPARDDYATKQDAAKFFRPAMGKSASISTFQQLRPQFWARDAESVLLTWDWYWGKEFHKNGEFFAYKTFQPMLGALGWWTVYFVKAFKGDPDSTVGRHNDAVRSGATPAGMKMHDPITPTGKDALPLREYHLRHSRWTRYWMEIKYLQPPSAFTEWNATYGVTVGPNPKDPDGRWHMVSLWAADETREATRLLYRAPMAWSGEGNKQYRLTAFHYEMSGQDTALARPLIGYARNFVLLADYTSPPWETDRPESDTTIFVKPIGSSANLEPPSRPRGLRLLPP